MYLSLALPYLAEKKCRLAFRSTPDTQALFSLFDEQKKKFNRLQYYLKFVIIYCFIFNWPPSRCSKADVLSLVSRLRQSHDILPTVAET